MASKLSRFLSARAQRRMPSAIRALQPLLSIPGMISLGGGMPNASLFPITAMSFSMRNEVTGTEEAVSLSPEQLGRALQYSPSFGVPDLTAQLKKIITRDHSPPNEFNVMVTTGSQDGLSKAFDMLIDEGDPVLVEQPTYSGALAALLPFNANLVPLQTDQQGLVPDSIEQSIEVSKQSSGKAPRVLYCIPTGQNPSGATLPNERRQLIYDLACKHDLLIIEDDPYWNLQLPPYAVAECDARRARPALQSFLSLDREERVLRFDSLSKVLSSGIRLGWVSGPCELIERLQLDQQATCLHPCGVSQLMVAALLERWGEEGWRAHVQKVQEAYGKRRDTFAVLCEKHLGGLPVTWTVPDAGMFFWFHLQNVEDTYALINEKALEEKVLLVPGVSFSPTGAKSSYCRAAFSTASEEDMDTALERFAALIRQA